MRYLEKIKSVGALEATKKQREDLEGYLTVEIEDALSSRSAQEGIWNEALRMYEALPEREFRDAPIEGFKNIEIPLIAVSTDAIWAQLVDMIFTVSPIVTIQAVGKEDVEGAKGLQRLANWGVNSLFGMRGAVEHSTLDDVQLGSGFYYVPWVEKRIKRKTDKLLIGGPKMYSIPPEDFIVPGGSTEDLQTLLDRHEDVDYEGIWRLEMYSDWDEEGCCLQGLNGGNRRTVEHTSGSRKRGK
jgi:hypothetical protein